MALRDDLREYINLSHSNAWLQKNPAVDKPDEPGYVSSLLSDGLYEGLRVILRNHAPKGATVVTHGVFCHQTPKVKIIGPPIKSVEIGDLLLVHQHFTPGAKAKFEGRALLLQAKRTRTPKTGGLTAGNEAIQFRLYQNWPRFKGYGRLYEGANKNIKYWDFKTKNSRPVVASDGASYLTVFNGHAYDANVKTPRWKSVTKFGPEHSQFVKNKYPNKCTWSIGGSVGKKHSAATGVKCDIDFADAFAEFLEGKRGRPFDLGKTPDDHWSTFVNLMLSLAVDKSYVYKLANQQIEGGKRGRLLSLLNALDTAHLFLNRNVNKISTAMHGAFSSHIHGEILGIGRKMGPIEPVQVQVKKLQENEHISILLVMTFGEEMIRFE